MSAIPCELLTIAALMLVGLWLETIGEKQGIIDECFAPVPLVCVGILYFLMLEAAV